MYKQLKSRLSLMDIILIDETLLHEHSAKFFIFQIDVQVELANIVKMDSARQENMVKVISMRI